MLKLRSILPLAILGAMATCANAQVRYTVAADPAHPTVATVTMQLPPVDAQQRTLVLPGVQWRLASQVNDPRCAGVNLPSPAPGEWIKPTGCHQVQWDVRFEPFSSSINAAQQRSLFFTDRHWWLLSQPTALLRIKDETKPGSLTIRAAGQSIRQMGATPFGADGEWLVPPASNAPEFYAFGNLDTVSRAIGTFRVRYIADDMPRVQRLKLLAAHRAALEYLAKVVPPPLSLPAAQRSLMVVFLGVDDKHHYLGGSAGHRSFIANYVYGNPEFAQRNAAFTVTTLAHEQFHQLVDMHSDRSDFSAGLEEGLAQYYGLKAMSHSPLSAVAKQWVWSRFVDPKRPVTVGLLEWARRNAAGDPAAYPMFYQQGATFWAEVDQALTHASANRHSLDDFVPLLLTAKPAAEGALPQAFVDALRAVAGSRIDTLISQYVGQPQNITHAKPSQ